MAKIKDLIDKLKKTTVRQQEEQVLKILRDDSEWIVDLNRVQLLEGKDSNDNALTEYRSKSYAKFKEKLNPLGVTDLKLTGKFHDSFLLQAREFPIKITAKDKKTNELVAKYGKDIFGLTDESKELLIQRLKAKVQDYYRRLIKV